MADDRFEADWLTLREPVDHRSRSAELERACAAAAREAGWVRAVDLGTGTGSNLRHLVPRLPTLTTWTLVDHDAALLERITAPSAGSGHPGAPDAHALPTPELELVHGTLEREGLDVVARCDLVTASALIDLVDAGWLDQLAARVAARGAGVLIALSYDGTARWRDVEHADDDAADPEPDAADPDDTDPDDAWMTGLIRAHQTREKGMGQALGPDAVAHAVAAFERVGLHCRVEASPWRLAGPADLPLARAWLQGWVEAAHDMAPDDTARIDAWAARRLAELARGAVAVDVGHLDLLALPARLAHHLGR